MEEGEQILGLWIGPDPQKTAHHYYALQVHSSPLRPNSFSTSIKIPSTIIHCGISQINLWRKNTHGP